MTRNALRFLALPAALTLGACATAPQTEADRSSLRGSVSAALDDFEATDPSLRGLLDRSAGYAVFPDVGKAGFIAGGAYGRGEVFEAGLRTGYAQVTKGSIGLQVGAQTFSELVVFTDRATLDDFKDGEFAFSADVSAVAIKPGAARAVDYTKGVVVFVNPKGGLMAEASVGGQGFNYTPVSVASANRDQDRMNDDLRYRGDNVIDTSGTTADNSSMTPR